MTSFLFPGQGSQYTGMAKDFHDNFNIAKLIFDEIEETTSLNLRKIIFENSSNELNNTNYTQLSIFVASCSIFKVINSEFDLKQLNVRAMLGHSLGEYSALVCSNMIKINNCAKLLKIRGDLMNKAVEPNKSGMVALIGLSSNEVEKIIFENNLNIQVANDNSPMQIVISGMNDELENSKQFFLSNKVKKFIKLNVSAAFHSNLMLNAQNELKKHIEKIDFLESDISIISNYSSKISNNRKIIKDCLSNQMANKVKWTESIIELANVKEKKLIEIGPGNTLSGLVKRINKSFEITSINQVNDLNLLK